MRTRNRCPPSRCYAPPASVGGRPRARRTSSGVRRSVDAELFSTIDHRAIATARAVRIMNHMKTTKTAAHHHIPASHFSATVKRALAKKGVLLVGMCTIPNWETGEYSNGETGYQLSDNGTSRIRTLLEVLAIAGDKKAAESCQRIATYREETMAARG